MMLLGEIQDYGQSQGLPLSAIPRRAQFGLCKLAVIQRPGRKSGYLSSDSCEQWTLPKTSSQPPGMQTVDEGWPFTGSKVAREHHLLVLPHDCPYCPVWKHTPSSCLHVQFTAGLRSRPLQKGTEAFYRSQTLHIDVFHPGTDPGVSIPWVTSSSSHTSVNVLSSMSAEAGVMDIRCCERLFSVQMF